MFYNYVINCADSVLLLTEVNRLILLTKNHEVDANDFIGKILVDLDLSILAASTVDYKMYTRAIRAEYANISNDLYIRGRIEFLQGLLFKTQLFYSPVYIKLESQARDNIRQEINSYL